MGRRIAESIGVALVFGSGVYWHAHGALPHPNYLIAAGVLMIAAVLVWK